MIEAHFHRLSRARRLVATMQTLLMALNTHIPRIIFHTICIMTRSQDDLESLAKRSKTDFTQTTASSQPVATSSR